ncbi:D-Ala-D-Ala carboxypeptidase family metallohydrolase [Altererythrobacter sp.]|uniref:D-Ala-D-Ala carboxypeptidase family metallohydrolase n=1 Tax=Altererythrobacter sp. TaxID=1872480 RepID=UPI003CFD4913
MTRRVLVFILLFATVAVAGWYYARERGGGLAAAFGRPVPYSQEAFTAWLREDPANREGFREFSQFLAEKDVSGVVPDWQLLRTDANLRRPCERPQFLLPPRSKWNNIVPPLELLRDWVIPELGKLEVISSYRTQQFNSCIGGASRSKHLGFHALDLIAPEQQDKREMFRRLCALQSDLGPGKRMGLGAYFRLDIPGKAGRFHIDTNGYRSWGYSYDAESSGCRLFR